MPRPIRKITIRGYNERKWDTARFDIDTESLAYKNYSWPEAYALLEKLGHPDPDGTLKKALGQPDTQLKLEF